MKRKVKLIIGIIIILIGLGIFSYPIVNTTYASYQQKKLMKEIKDQIRKNMDAKKPSVTDTVKVSEDDSKPTKVPKKEIDEEFNSLELENEDTQADDLYSNVTVSERLNGQNVIGIIEIPKIELVYAIVEGTEHENIGVAIGHFKDSAQIGEKGNCALAGHRGGTSGPYFKNIDMLVSGDVVSVTNVYGEVFDYIVYDSFVVEPYETYVVKPLEEKGTILTMVTCTDNGTRRLIVHAKIKES